jgi:hypothetical protein
MNELKVVAVGKDGGPVRVGKDFIELEDRTVDQFTTCIVADFLSYIKGLEKSSALYYNEKSIKALRIMPDHDNAEPVAVCELKNTTFLNQLIEANMRQIPVKTFRDMLYSMRGFYDKNGKELYDRALNFSLSTITNFEQSADNQGNFHFNVTCEKTGSKDVAFPETVTFKVPVFELMSDTVELTFDVVLDHCITKEKVEVSFCLKNPQLSTVIRMAQKEIVEQHLQDFAGVKFWGNLEVKKQDDSWKYQDNGIN